MGWYARLAAQCAVDVVLFAWVSAGGYLIVDNWFKARRLHKDRFGQAD